MNVRPQLDQYYVTFDGKGHRFIYRTSDETLMAIVFTKSETVLSNRMDHAEARAIAREAKA